MRAKQDYTDMLVDLYWEDAFDDSEVHPTKIADGYYWHTYGRVIRQTPHLITIATNEGGEGEDERVHTTTVLWTMVRSVTVLTPPIW
jgi:hypothetical protein